MSPLTRFRPALRLRKTVLYGWELEAVLPNLHVPCPKEVSGFDGAMKYVDSCPNQPVCGMAFCTEHCVAASSSWIPCSLRDFLRYSAWGAFRNAGSIILYRGFKYHHHTTPCSTRQVWYPRRPWEVKEQDQRTCRSFRTVTLTAADCQGIANCLCYLLLFQALSIYLSN